MKLVFSPKAVNDLEEIGDYIARDNPERALSFIAEIEERCRKLLVTPEAFPSRDNLLPGARMVSYGRYLIFFRLVNGTVRVERIIHGARDLRNLL
ncbi:type II toxin-antitoxin system RelE/ParE family toxin [Nostoc sp. CHAB 5715]|uniref:type II toxin-antitoxin system RelE/ParE family toxin n=1 Tax=Nostoc sp. CHAB 5715 TaxID=2780400 RepID=UPI001E2BE6C8|nr:type II toxin-antitoxin system RelE/ParE family toxin [Nostoc sp. CHAB 5715]MCC5621135.1 type II toxin-antitoxin system RelE/ParE family toxin [Nostoc sp. CHAB 5715]